MIEIRRYVTRSGKDVFGDWLARLVGNQVKARILARIDRLAVGNFGDSKHLRGGVSELRIHWGPGYRIYYAMIGRTCLCCCAVATNASSHPTLKEQLNTCTITGKGTSAMKRTKASISHDEAMIRQLREEPDFAAEYLRAALEDDDEPRVLLVALRRVAEARGGIAKVAKAAGVERESLYRALSAHGNPRLSTLAAVTKAMGLKLTVEAG